MKKSQDLLTVSEAANKINVSEETVRRWIRSKNLFAKRSGREFLISKWHLESFILTGGKPLYENFDLLTSCSLGFRPAFFGSSLFDLAYYKVEKQWERIQEDRTLIEKTLERQREELRDTHKEIQEWHKKMEDTKDSFDPIILSQRPVLRITPNYWSLPQRTLFVDIHFYFVAVDDLRKSVDHRLIKDISDPVFTNLVEKYRSVFEDINTIRGVLEHQYNYIIHPEYSSDFGNIGEKGFHFGNKYYNFYIEDIRKLRNELCDFFLSKTLPESSKNK